MDAIWDIAQGHPQFKSKRFTKQMLQHLKKIRVARTQRVDNQRFGYMLTARARPFSDEPSPT